MKHFLFLIGLLGIVFASCSPYSDKSEKKDNNSSVPNIESNQPEVSKQNNTVVNPQNEPSIIGSWSLSNPPKNVSSINFVINSDGSMIMRGTGSKNSSTETKTINCSWSKNGNKVYVSAPGESEVGVMEILSLDQNSLVVHFQGEPDDEIMYFRRN